MKLLFNILLFLKCFNDYYSFNLKSLISDYAKNDGRRAVIDGLKSYDPTAGVPKRQILRNIELNTRRRKDIISDDTSSSSSSVEEKKWKDEWRELWLMKKLEAINMSAPTGDAVNMVAARPWGVPCGDPNQHDQPWGTCMLPIECEAEYRIYRGDYYCGRTSFICCALQHTNYDQYGGFDISFEDSDFETDSAEKKNRDRGSSEKKKRKRKREKNRRQKERSKRKKKIKRLIDKIQRQIKKILNNSYRNGTKARRRKTKELKKFIKEMKKKYRKDRKLVRDVHESEMIKIDAALQKRLHDIQDMNQNFVKNGTFRDIVVNGTVNRDKLRLLLEAYPELQNMIHVRRSGGQESPDYLEYDVEYGYLYY